MLKTKEEIDKKMIELEDNYKTWDEFCPHKDVDDMTEDEVASMYILGGIADQIRLLKWVIE